MTITERLRGIFGNLLNTIGAVLLRVGIKPDHVTVFGVVLNCIAAFFTSRGDFILGGLFVLVSGPMDAIDGTLARLQGNPKPFGAFLDSVSDRLSEMAIMFGFFFYFLGHDSDHGCILAFFAILGSVLVSYIRARAQSLGSDPKIGILTRVERYLVTTLCLLLNQPIIGLWILAILTNFTAAQRIWYVWKELH
jgi:CDP-diacylglycerol--glycerol-3-phosphate 3-phosphatidyltransferase